jgi:hypothetical protein
MPTFRVRFARDRTEYATFEVEATDEEAAEEAGLDWIDNGNPVDWDVGEDTDTPYILAHETEAKGRTCIAADCTNTVLFNQGSDYCESCLRGDQ